MYTVAAVIQEPNRVELQTLELASPGAGDMVVDIRWSGISSGTERLLWSGKMPKFPGMGYPLVPGYESVGVVVEAGADCTTRVGDWVFVPGATCYGAVRGLFGGSASRLVSPEVRTVPVAKTLEADGTLLALAATAYHAIDKARGHYPDLIVGHGVLGRLLARITIALGAAPPTVWETASGRRTGDCGYRVIHPGDDDRRDYNAIYDVSGDASMLDSLVSRLAPGGEIVLAGFYAERLSFDFPLAFMREARFRIAAQWLKGDLEAVASLVECGSLSLGGLISHRESAQNASAAYRTAFEDPACLKMILDWSGCA